MVYCIELNYSFDTVFKMSQTNDYELIFVASQLSAQRLESG